MKYRFRVNIFGKVVLQVQDSYLRSGFSLTRVYYWRDAKIEDITETDLLKEMIND